MSEYQQRKARALELQRQKEEQFKREQAAKAERDKQRAREEEEKRKQRDAAAKEARRLELMRANEALIAGKNAASNGNEEWDPFAEDERPKAAPSLLNAKAAPRPRSTASPASKPTPSASKPRSEPKAGSSSAPKVKRNKSPEPLGRKERAARAMAQAAKKSKGADLFDIRSLVEGREGPSPAVASASLHRKPPSNGNGYNAGRANGSGGMSRLGSNGGGNIKDRLNATLKGEGMRKLCPDRSTRDRRTIDEIHTDIKSRKGAAEAPRIKPPRPSVPTTARPARRDRSPSEEYSSDDGDRRGKKRYRDESAYEHEPDRAYISAEIQALFRRPGAAPRRYDDDYSDASSDMEAGLSDVEEEETRAARIARREDLEAERLEREHREAKEKIKRERERRERERRERERRGKA